MLLSEASSALNVARLCGSRVNLITDAETEHNLRAVMQVPCHTPCGSVVLRSCETDVLARTHWQHGMDVR